MHLNTIFLHELSKLSVRQNLSKLTHLAGTASNREVKLLLTVSFLNDDLGIE